jgi:hypothetical protein
MDSVGSYSVQFITLYYCKFHHVTAVTNVYMHSVILMMIVVDSVPA